MIWNYYNQNGELLTFFILIYQKGNIIVIINNAVRKINLNQSMLNKVELISDYPIEPYGYRIYICN